MKHKTFLFICLTLLCVACGRKGQPKEESQDFAAKKAMQGVWVDEDEEDVVFSIKGDTVSFPDSTIMPVYFMVKSDSFVLCGVNRVAYPIVKRTPHLFVFVNRNGEQVRLVKSDDASYADMFGQKKEVVAINQNKLLKRDTVVTFDGERYHSYVQVNPTTYKVLRTSYNDDGVEVGNVYHDNIIHLSVYQGARKVYSQNVSKQQFVRMVPKGVLAQTVFSDLVFLAIDKEGIHYNVVLAIPDSMTSYIVELVVGFNGTTKMRVGK